MRAWVYGFTEQRREILVKSNSPDPFCPFLFSFSPPCENMALPKFAASLRRRGSSSSSSASTSNLPDANNNRKARRQEQRSSATYYSSCSSSLSPSSASSAVTSPALSPSASRHGHHQQQPQHGLGPHGNLSAMLQTSAAMSDAVPSTRFSSESARAARQYHRTPSSSTLVILDLYYNRPGGWHFHVAQLKDGKKTVKVQNVERIFSVPVTKLGKKQHGVPIPRWDVSELLDREYPGWQKERSQQRKFIREYEVIDLAYFDYPHRSWRVGRSAPKEVCEFGLQPRQNQDSLLRRMARAVPLLR